MSSELENLDLLEDRVRRIREVARALRQDNAEMSARLQEAEEKLRKSEETIAVLEEENSKSEEMSRQLQLLQEERLEIRGRVSRMLETFSSIEELQPTGHPDN